MGIIIDLLITKYYNEINKTTNMGLLTGRGCERNMQAAFEWYKAAAENTKSRHKIPKLISLRPKF